MFEKSKWIRVPCDIGTISPEFRLTFLPRKKVAKATVYASAMGVYNLLVNGKKIGDAFMAPGCTSFRKRLQYQAYDITDAIEPQTSISLVCGTGWAVGYYGYIERRFSASDHVSVIAEIVIEYTDGTELRIGTDESWEVFTSQILYSELYFGETFDLCAKIEKVGNALIDNDSKPVLVPQVGERVCEHERIAAKKIIKTPKNETVIDFGQNLGGYVEVRIKGNRGDRIVFDHAEVLDSNGCFYTDNYRGALNEVTYVLSGDDDVLKPHFCFQGYRYIRIKEFPEHIKLESKLFTSVAVYSDIKRTGYFVCGNDKINRLYENILWGQRSNFLDIPTDCPQRDERLGWTGDAQVFIRTAAINYNVKKFFKKWLEDLMIDQRKDGSIYGVSPLPATSWGYISAGWGDAAVICPWEIYCAYGDVELLREHFPMMKKWVEYIHHFGEAEYLWLGGTHYGDWLALDESDGNMNGATQTDLIASAYFAYSTSLLIKAGKVLGEDMREYEDMLVQIKLAFQNTFMKDGLPVLFPKYDGLSENRTVKGVTQTSLALILAFNLCKEEEKKKITDTLVRLIEESGMRMTTGFLGTPYILRALAENGRCDIAYELLLQEKNPSWLFSVNHGATTMWEHWDSMKEDGSFWDAKMNSFNHYAYGSVFDWIFEYVVGISIAEGGAGYRKIKISPCPDKRMKFARGEIETQYGKVSVSWQYFEDGVRYEVEIPQNITAEMMLEGQELVELKPGTTILYS